MVFSAAAVLTAIGVGWCVCEIGLGESLEAEADEEKPCKPLRCASSKPSSCASECSTSSSTKVGAGA